MDTAGGWEQDCGELLGNVGCKLGSCGGVSHQVDGWEGRIGVKKVAVIK